jgi:hypothetical protein
MLAPFTRFLTDLSTTEGFRFQFACAICGRTWASAYKSLDLGQFARPLPQDLKALIWENGHLAAFRLAEAEALFHFNHCDVCDRWVCDSCYRPSAWPSFGEACIQCSGAGGRASEPPPP